MKGYIYRIENKINGKCYIGKTYLTIEKRWNQHVKDSRREEFKNRPIYKAINKYGIENFLISEIEYSENCEEREKFWISFYNSFNDGYNATLGGDGKSYFEYSDDEVIQKYSELKYVKDVAKYFNCDVETIRKRLINNNIEIKNDYKNNIWKIQPVNQFDLKNNFIQTFSSMNQAAIWLKLNNFTKSENNHIITNISRNARGVKHRKQAYGFIWKLVEYGK